MPDRHVGRGHAVHASEGPTGARDSSHCLLDPQELAEWMLADNIPARLGLQLHKFIWDPAVKGV